MQYIHIIYYRLCYSLKRIPLSKDDTIVYMIKWNVGVYVICLNVIAILIVKTILNSLLIISKRQMVREIADIFISNDHMKM